MDSVRAVPDEMRGFCELLERNANYFKSLDQYAGQTASHTGGFTGVMMLLIPVVEGITALFGETLDFAHGALLRVKDELEKTAEEYEQREDQIIEILRRIEADLDKLMM